MKIIEAPPECPKCNKRNLFACLAHRPPPANPSWVIHIYCRECHWFIIIDCKEISSEQIKAFKTEENQNNLAIVTKAHERDITD